MSTLFKNSFNTQSIDVLSDDVIITNCFFTSDNYANFFSDSANINNSIVKANEKIIIATSKVDCSSSTIIAPKIYVENNANFGNCKLEGEVHYEDATTLLNMRPQDSFSTRDSQTVFEEFNKLFPKHDISNGNLEVTKKKAYPIKYDADFYKCKFSSFGSNSCQKDLEKKILEFDPTYDVKCVGDHSSDCIINHD